MSIFDSILSHSANHRQKVDEQYQTKQEIKRAEMRVIVNSLERVKPKHAHKVKKHHIDPHGLRLAVKAAIVAKGGHTINSLAHKVNLLPESIEAIIAGQTVPLKRTQAAALYKALGAAVLTREGAEELGL